MQNKRKTAVIKEKLEMPSSNIIESPNSQIFRRNRNHTRKPKSGFQNIRPWEPIEDPHSCGLIGIHKEQDSQQSTGQYITKSRQLSKPPERYQRYERYEHNIII